MDQHFIKKTIKIQAWRHQNRGPEGSGAGWEASWAILGHPGRFGSVLDRLGSVFEASWKPPGPSWVEKGGQHGSKLAPKTKAKSIKKRSKNLSILLMPLGIAISRFFFDFWNQKPSHVGSKMHSKIDFILTNPESPKLL